MNLRIVLLFFILGSFTKLIAQSTNVDCSSAFEIADVSSYCSGDTEWDNDDVGGSVFAAPSCWAEANNDLWFTFIASQKAINIIVNGELGGTLDNPEISLSRGEDCTMQTEFGACSLNSTGLEITSLFYSNLVIGARYYIRVDGRTSGNDGSFQLCVESFTPPVVPGQDCETASFLCNKDPFVVESIFGGGIDDREADGSCLQVNNDPSENNSTWFKWTCSVSGTFTLDLRPLVPADDYDFAIFELTNGIEDCERTLLRCVANAVENDDDNIVCGSLTGLDLTSTDLEEDLDCNAGEDGYVRFIDMVAGVSYAMIINNFSESRAGFALDFGGTAEFAGPEADFEVAIDPSDPCGGTLLVTNLSTANLSPITEFEWEFGDDANPTSGSGEGPFTVTYSGLGEKNITLKIMSEFGCQVFETKTINLDACSYQENLFFVVDSIRNNACGENDNGYLEIAGSLSCANLEFNIDGGSFQSTGIFENLTNGDHTIRMQDPNGCFKDTTLSISGVAEFSLDIGDDVTINSGESVDITTMISSTDNLTISWDPPDNVVCPDGTTNCLNPTISPTVTTTYTITVDDGSGCTGTDMITIFIDLCGGSNLGIAIDSIGDLVCQGGSNGFVAISGINGPPQFQYSIDNIDFSDNGLFDNLGIGDYTLTVIDGFGCRRDTMISIGVFPPFNVDAGDDVTFNMAGDTIILDGSTDATGINSILWSPGSNIICSDGSLNCLNPTANPITSSLYTLTVTDENGCSASDDVLLTFVENINVFVPNIFSPNDDGVNDIVSIFADPLVVSDIETFVIFDRWGNKVYQGSNLSPSDPNNGWDGLHNNSKAKVGVYTWYATLKYFSRPDDDADFVKGSITLIR